MPRPSSLDRRSGFELPIAIFEKSVAFPQRDDLSRTALVQKPRSPRRNSAAEPSRSEEVDGPRRSRYGAVPENLYAPMSQTPPAPRV